MGQTLLIDHEKLGVDQRLIDRDPAAALKCMIAQQTNGQSCKDFLHCVVRSVVPRNDNALKRLLYYYLETLGDDGSLVVCLNQISKDLESPNEYVRGLVLNFISTLRSADYVALLLKGVRANLSNKSAYVRMAAVACLCAVSERHDIDVEDELAALARQEASPEVLRMLFHAMHRLGMPVEPYLDTAYPPEVLDFLIDATDDLEFLLACAGSRHAATAFKASSRILRGCLGDGRSIRDACVENVLRILGEDPGLRADFVPTVRYVEGHALELLGLLDPYEPEYSRRLVEQAFQNAETHEFFKVAELLRTRYIEAEPASERKRAFRIMLLESMAAFAQSHCLYAPDMVGACIGNLGLDDVELVYASLGLLSAIVCGGAAGGPDGAAGGAGRERDRELVTEQLIRLLSQLRHGRVLRLVFDIIAQCAGEAQFETLLDTLLGNFDRPTPYLTQCEVFIGTHICLAIVGMCQPQWGCRAKALGVVVRFLQHGGRHGTMDASSRATITLCARALLAGVRAAGDGAPPAQQSFAKVETLCPLAFSLLSTPLQAPRFEWTDPLDTCMRTVQLSGLGDPLYVEANMAYNRHELVLDLLVINQTEHYLQEISLEFLASKYVSQVSRGAPLSLQAGSAHAMQVAFSIEESSSCFVSASAMFRFPRQQEYSTFYVQNLNDIAIDVGRFLEGASLDFKHTWQDLEWENIYLLTLGSASPDRLLDCITAATNGTICDRYCSSRFLVANVACFTSQRAPVLLNVCLSSADSVVAEIRVRSRDEEVVKDVSMLVSTSLKCIK